MSHFREWYRLRNSEQGTLEYQTPWMVFESITFLKDWLKPTMRVFEYGSGGSTLFFANRVNKIYSIDHNPEWFKITNEAIKQNNLNNVDYNLIEPVFDSEYDNKNYLNPEHFISAGIEFKGRNFLDYAKAIDRFDDGYFDLVIVDGRARQSCIRRAMPKIRKGGILLLDNADREYYLKLNPGLTGSSLWQRRDYVGHFPFCSASVLEITSLFTKLI